jgi:hypothetical protein
MRTFLDPPTHEPIICRRCNKEIADEFREKGLEAALRLAEDGFQLAAKCCVEFANKYCTCDEKPHNEFTSRPQPPNLDSIERRLK